MDKIPIIDYRFSDKYFVTEFVTPTSYAILEAIKDLPDSEAIARFICDKFVYPLDYSGNPTATGQLLRYRKSWFSYFFKACRYYVWAFPAEVLITKLCYCAESGNLATSLLIARNIDAWSVVGEVRSSRDDTIIGYHLWTQLPRESEDWVLETTIHTEGANNLVRCKGAYDKNSDWAQQGGIYYLKKGWFNDKEFHGDAELLTTLHLPAKRLMLFGREATEKIKPKQLYRELMRENKQKENLLRIAYGG